MNLFRQLVGLLGPGGSARLKAFTYTGHHKTEKHRHIYTSSGMRSHDRNFRAVEDCTSLRPRGQWNEILRTCYVLKNRTVRSEVDNRRLEETD